MATKVPPTSGLVQREPDSGFYFWVAPGDTVCFFDSHAKAWAYKRGSNWFWYATNMAAPKPIPSADTDPVPDPPPKKTAPAGSASTAPAASTSGSKKWWRPSMTQVILGAGALAIFAIVGTYFFLNRDTTKAPPPAITKEEAEALRAKIAKLEADAKKPREIPIVRPPDTVPPTPTTLTPEQSVWKGSDRTSRLARAKAVHDEKCGGAAFDPAQAERLINEVQTEDELLAKWVCGSVVQTQPPPQAAPAPGRVPKCPSGMTFSAQRGKCV